MAALASDDLRLAERLVRKHVIAASEFALSATAAESSPVRAGRGARQS